MKIKVNRNVKYQVAEVRRILLWQILGGMSVVLTTFLSSTQTVASAALDRQYRLETIGVLKSQDNSDDFLAGFVSNAFHEYFSRQSRFVLNELSKADSILLDSSIPYSRLAADSQVIGQIARSTQTDSIIRTHVTKRNQKYFFTLEWLHSPQMELIGEESFDFAEPVVGTPLDSLKLAETFRVNLDKLFEKIPFSGNVTGRDNRTLTVNLGADDNRVSVGDFLTLGTLDEVKKHPLLKRIVEWKVVVTGKAVVEQVEQNMAFCKIVEEVPGKEIARLQKLLLIEHPPKIRSVPPGLSGDQETDVETESQAKLFDKKTPNLGWISAGFISGLFGRDSSNSVTTRSGGGFELGAKIEGQLWLTQHWFAGAELRYGFWNFSQLDLGTGLSTAASANGGVSSSLSGLALEVGYAHAFTSSFFGPKAWLKLGYKSSSFRFPVSVAENTGPIDFGAAYLGIGGRVPFRDGWALLANLNFGLLTSANQDWLQQTATGASQFDLFLGADYRIFPRFLVRAGIEYGSWGADYSSGATFSLSSFMISPTLLYYF